MQEERLYRLPILYMHVRSLLVVVYIQLEDCVCDKQGVESTLPSCVCCGPNVSTLLVFPW
jgi:hypothetical protein